MTELRSVCVFCGSSFGNDPIYKQAAQELGTALAKAGLQLIYGGGNVGLMGTVADAVMEAGGSVIGVIPKFLLEREVGHRNLTELHIVETMHERKAKMASLSDAFAIMPGGIGTLEEMFEIWTWSQLHLHNKPCALLNTAGYYDQLNGFLDHMLSQDFLKPEARCMMMVANTPEVLISELCNASDGVNGCLGIDRA
jgi:uncharacterized protein (TIGR00730 family)